MNRKVYLRPTQKRRARACRLFYAAPAIFVPTTRAYAVAAAGKQLANQKAKQAASTH